MKKLISAVLLAALFALNASCACANKLNTNDAVLEVQKVIDAHKSDIQRKNGALLKTEPRALAAADFAEFDTSSELIGTDLYKFSSPAPASGTNNVRTISAMNGFPALFDDGTVLRASDRAAFVMDFSEEVPSFQAVMGKKNIYVENIDFYGFRSLNFEYCENVIFNNCTFKDFTHNGLVFRSCKNISVINCEFENCGHEITDYASGGFSIRISGDENNPSKNILIENCKIENSAGYAISLVNSADDFVIRNNNINNSVWSAINYWMSDISGAHVNVVENNVCTNTGFGKPSLFDAQAKKSGVGCSAIFMGKGENLKNTVIKNNTVKCSVENGIESSCELVYHNTVQDTGVNSVNRYTASTEGIYIKPAWEFEQKIIGNTVSTHGVRCITSYSDSDTEYAGVYILGNSLKLEAEDKNTVCMYKRSCIEINYPKLKKLVISSNSGMSCNEESVNVYIRDKNYKMKAFELDNPCRIGSIPQAADYYKVNAPQK